VQAAPPAADQGGAVQGSPEPLPSPARGGAPILPPVASPQQQPSWKQEVRGTPEGGDKPTE
jgi:hypothetical protein